MQELLHSLGIEWPILIAQLVNFAILLCVLHRFVYKPVIKAIDERRESARVTVEKEEYVAKLLMSAGEEREKVLGEARRESQALLETARQSGEQLKRKMVVEAKAETARMESEADRKNEEEKIRMISEVKAELGGLVVSAIEHSLGDVLDERIQGRMVEQALAAIREGDTNGKHKDRSRA
jgi:F-type H+-transporting ATPase subunit b